MGHWPAAAGNRAFGIEGRFSGAVLDAGCGTGENGLHITSLGLPVLGIDVAETALAIAQKKTADRGIKVEFAAADAFHLERLGRMFETVLDCGLFHTFDADERPRYVVSLASVTNHDGTLYLLCFSDDRPRNRPAPHKSGGSESCVQPQHWVEHRSDQTRPDSDQIPQRRRTGLVGHNQTDLECATGLILPSDTGDGADAVHRVLHPSRRAGTSTDGPNSLLPRHRLLRQQIEGGEADLV